MMPMQALMTTRYQVSIYYNIYLEHIYEMTQVMYQVAKKWAVFAVLPELVLSLSSGCQNNIHNMESKRRLQIILKGKIDPSTMSF